MSMSTESQLANAIKNLEKADAKAVSMSIDQSLFNEYSKACIYRKACKTRIKNLNNQLFAEIDEQEKSLSLVVNNLKRGLEQDTLYMQEFDYLSEHLESLDTVKTLDYLSSVESYAVHMVADRFNFAANSFLKPCLDIPLDVPCGMDKIHPYTCPTVAFAYKATSYDALKFYFYHKVETLSYMFAPNHKFESESLFALDSYILRHANAPRKFFPYSYAVREYLYDAMSELLYSLKMTKTRINRFILNNNYNGYTRTLKFRNSIIDSLNQLRFYLALVEAFDALTLISSKVVNRKF